MAAYSSRPVGLAQLVMKVVLGVLFVASHLSIVGALHSTDTFTSGGDNTRSGYQPNHNMDPSIVGSDQFGILWRRQLLGNYRGFAEQIYAQPLVYTPSNKQYVYISTQQNWVYKLDASTGEILASRKLHIPFLVSDLDGCNDIANLIGNTATGVIDPATNTWYLTTKTYRDQTDVEKGRLNGRYYIHALDCDTLDERPNFPINLEGVIATNNPIRMFQGGNHHQRPALIQAGPYFYAGFASHCVQYNFTGWIIGWNSAGQLVEHFSTEGGPEANVKGGGLWMSGGGISSDNNNRLFFATGNGYASQLHGTPVPGRQPPTALEEAAVHMVINGDGSLSVVDFFMPWEKEQLDGADKDLGTSPLVLLDPTVFKSPRVARIGVVTGKSGKTYFLNIDDLGGYQMGPNNGDAVPQVSLNDNSVFAGAGSYPLEGGYVYINPVRYPTAVYQFSVSPDGNPVFTKVAQTAESSAFVLGVGHGTTTSLNGQPGTGLYWVTDVQGYQLRIYKAVPVNGILQPLKFLNLPGQVKFSRPSFGNGRAYFTTSTGSVVAVGSPTNPPFTCSPPYNFGEVIIGQASASKTITCKANINIRVDAIQLGSTQNFALSGLPTLPYNVNAGQNFTFQATFSPTSPGPLSENIYVNTTNSVPNYASNTPIGLNGDGKSLSPVLAINPNTVSFHGFIIGENPQGATSSVIFSNLGEAALNITMYQWSTVSESGPFIQPNSTNGTSSVLGPYTITGTPSTIPGNSQATININFNPQEPGSYPLYAKVLSNGGTGIFTVVGIAGSYPKALLEFEKVDGSGWVTYSNSTPFDFGQVYEGTTRNLNMRLSNVGGPSAGLLGITVSKPPIGAGQIVGARNGIDLGEGTTLGPGESMNATLFCSVPKAQVNTDPYEATAVWTMNTGDPAFGKQIIRFLCHAVAEQVGPLTANGTGRYRYIGCYKENNPGRQLQTQLYGSDLNTNGKCQTDCAATTQNWIFAGTQYHRECWCGNKIPTQKVNDADCNYDCSGNSSQMCGGNGFNNPGSYISLFADADRFTPGNASTTTTSTTGTPTATPTSTGPAIIPTIGDYTFQGCYTEATQGRALGDKTVNQPDMNLNYCAGNCTGFTYWGVEYGTECYCGNTLGAGSALATNQGDCNFPCPSNQSQYCGAGLRLELYKLSGNTTVPAPTGPSHPNTISNFTYQGCYTEATTGRALSAKTIASNDMTLDYCAGNCTGYTYFGAEYAKECYCGNSLGSGSVPATNQGDCKMTCKGNSSQFCGAGLRLDLYKVGAPSSTSLSSTTTANFTTPATSSTTPAANSTTPATSSTTPAVNPTTPATSSTTSATSSTTPATNSTTPTTSSTTPATSSTTPVTSISSTSSTATSTPTGPIHPPTAGQFSYAGCYTEATSGRALSGKTIATNDMNVDYCAGNCTGFAYFGVEYGRECYCGNSLGAGSVSATNQGDCKMKCAGNPSQLCGASLRLDLYTSTVNVTGPAIVWTIGAYKYQGCYTEATTGRALTGKSIASNDMTLDYCYGNCTGFAYWGTEFGRECYCGNTLSAGSVNATNQGDCNMLCAGNTKQFCGAGSRLEMYKNSTLP